ncbi:MAG: hypothetical protein LBP68_08495, partial [Acidobacteriota bacterium]|nr:hypothetical protein [Acidobacteriota bacterium]
MAGYSLSGGHSSKPVVFLIIIALVVLATVGVAVFHVGSTPDIDIRPAMTVIGKRTPVAVNVIAPRRGLTRVQVELVQDGKAVTLADKTYEPSSQVPFLGGSGTEKDELAVEAGLQSFPGLQGGDAVIRVTAGRAGTWLRSPSDVVEELTLPVRLTPPTLQVTSTQTYVSQGGSEVVTYRVGESATRDGVRAGIWWFPGHPLPGGGPRDRFTLFAIPYDMPKPEVRLVAEDAAGNTAETGFIDKFTPRPLRTDTIQVSDPFLNRIVPPILSQTPEIREQGT